MDIVLTIPGLGGSDAAHWQSFWEADRPNCRCVLGIDWNLPDKGAWLSALDNAIKACDTPPILAAHSLGCLLAVHWALRMNSAPVKGALLVAPADVDSRDHTPAETACFAPIPLGVLPFPATLVASSNDPYCGLGRAQLFATAWGADFVNTGERGHLNSDSHLGAWDDGWDVLGGVTTPNAACSLEVS